MYSVHVQYVYILDTYPHDCQECVNFLSFVFQYPEQVQYLHINIHINIHIHIHIHINIHINIHIHNVDDKTNRSSTKKI
jgi:hypothetical protein